jgi:predicted phage tail protein
MQITEITGHKGGKGGGSSGGLSESPNTMRSKAVARLIDLISEGPTVGIVGGHKGVYIDGTPLQNDDNSYNFEGIVVEERTGLPTQDIISGFPSAENPVDLGSISVTTVNPRTFTVSDSTVDAVRVTVGVPMLQHMNSKGALRWDYAALEIWLKTNTGSYVKVQDVEFNGKTSSPYHRSIRVDLPPGGAPWTVKIVRVTPDATVQSIQNETVLVGYSEIIDAKLSYPDCAIVGITADAEKFGNSVKSRTYKYRGLIISVPTNYDPETRVYTGIWNGTFKQAWTNNPAWVLYAMLTNPRFGLGDIIPAASVDKWGLYAIAQYCDQLVPNGAGGTEPRYVFNGVLRSREDAARVLDSISSSFRGMIYWGAGAVMVTQDSPSTPAKLVTPANVIDGNFEYVGSSLQTRSSSVAVSYADPADLGKTAVAVVQRDDLIQKFGDRRKDIAAVGCTSRSQAIRMAEWMLFTEAYETEVVTYRAALDHADVRPGQLISIADPAYAGARFGGRLVSTPTYLTAVLDAPVAFSASETYSISMVNPEGDIITRGVANPGDVTTANVTLVSGMGAVGVRPTAGAMWIITASDAAPRTFRVISNTEREKNIYEVTALYQAPGKFDYVERDVELPQTDYIAYPEGPIAPPSALVVQQYLRPVPGSEAKLEYIIGWTQSPDARVSGYRVWLSEGGGEELIWSGPECSTTYVSDANEPTTVTVIVRAVDITGKMSAAITSGAVPTDSTFEAPSTPTGWTAVAGSGTAMLSGDESLARNFKEFVIYASATAGGTYTKIGATRTTEYTRTIPANNTKDYYKVAVLTHDGQESAKTAAMHCAPLSKSGPATISTPTGLAVTSALLTDGSARVTATWTPPPEANIAAYDVSVSENGGGAVTLRTTAATFSFKTIAGTPVTVSVRAINSYGTYSGWTAVVNHTAAADSVPPAVPSGFTAKGTFEAVWLNIATRNTESDFDFYEIYESATTTAPSAGTTATFRMFSETMARTDLPREATTRHYWARAVDVSGNKSAWTARVPATTVALVTEDIAGLIDAGSFTNGVEPVTIVSTGGLPTVKSTTYIQYNGALYKWNGTAYVPAVAAADLSGLILPNQIDARGLNILDLYGATVFGADGTISPAAHITTGGNTISLSTIAANSLVPSLNFVGQFAVPPTSVTLGADWRQNAVYYNTVDGKSYVLTGTPLAWMQYLSDGNAWYLTIESSNGTVFRVGQSSTTLMSARLFKNGAEVTDVTPAAWFRWRRVSVVNPAPPNDDAAWNAARVSGYKSVTIDVDQVLSRATFFCDIISS